ncbi:MAG: CHAT domain-containing protein [Saprospiraceae bacterium]|nr:CHAT domain-containing protein [Saprospiraceae bacterium]
MYAQLTQLKKNPDKRIRFNLKKGIQRKFGAKKKIEITSDNSWWHIFDTQVVGKGKNLPRLQFISSSGIARIELENTFTPPAVIDSLLASLMRESIWDEKYSKTLFELLIPYQFKDIIRQHNNVIWKLDIDAAAYPWEMFHDPEHGNEPTFVNAGLIRQLISTNARMRTDIVRNTTALIIGDPDYTGKDLPQLSGALAEAKAVDDLINSYPDFKTIYLPNRQGNEILMNLCCEEYKILHIAGHGLVSDNPNETGIALDGKMMILPAMFANFSRLPEFVFINCCNSGTIIPGKEKYFEKRYKFAANIGTELIRLGVNAVVVTGWPVNDTGARIFAETLYTQLLDGVRFGDAVRIARKACYAKDPANNTWGAYQCYGDPWYQLMLKPQSATDGKEYISEDEVLADLYNIKSETELLDPKTTSPSKIKDKLVTVLARSKKDGFDGGKVLEQEAEILSELDELDDAIGRLEMLRQENKADYSIRSIEQYCNLRIKKLLKTKIDPKTKKGLPELKKAMSRIEEDFKYLLLIGETPERLCLLGSAYKKLASLAIRNEIINNKKNKAQAYLTLAEDHYRRAYKLMDKAKLPSLIYPLTNWLNLYAINTQKSTIDINGKSDILISSFLDQLAKDLRGSFSKTLTSGKISSMVNVLQTQLFYTDDLDKVRATGTAIINHYKHAWKTGGTLKNLQTEEEQLDWIADGLEVMVGVDKEWLNAMRKVVVEVKKGLRGLR